jgi:hypothetical protein
MLVAVEATGAALLHCFEMLLIVAIERSSNNSAGWTLTCHLHSSGAEPLYIDEGHQPVWQEAADGGVELQTFNPSHIYS